MSRSFFRVPLLGAFLSFLLLVPGAATANVDREVRPAEGRAIARALLGHPGLKLLNFHVSGMRDEATAKHNLLQAAAGKPVKRSYYRNGPGGSIELDVRMLRALKILLDEGYTFRVTEFAGGSHSGNSRHYAGVAFDIDTLNGRRISYGHPVYRKFLRRCRQLGATEILGPGTRGHSRHLHVAWPRE